MLQHEHRLFHGRDAAIEKSRETTVLASMPGIETNDGRSLERGWECDWRLHHRFELRRRGGEFRRRHRLRRRFDRCHRGRLFNTAEKTSTRERENRESQYQHRPCERDSLRPDLCLRTGLRHPRNWPGVLALGSGGSRRIGRIGLGLGSPARSG